MPTFQVCLIVPAGRSIATTVFWPLTAAYRVDPSGENAIPAVSARRPFASGIAILVPAAKLPSALTGNLVIPVALGMKRKLPSGEYSGLSWPTVLSDRRMLTPAAVPPRQISR